MSSLEQAVAALAARKRWLDQNFEHYSEEMWAAVNSTTPGFGPRWYREITTKYAVGGAHFFYALSDDPLGPGICTLPRPYDVLQQIPCWPIPVIARYGWFAFAYGGRDGSVWVFRNDAPPDPAVFFLHADSWTRGEPTEDDGLINPRISLSALFSLGAAWGLPDEPQYGYDIDALISDVSRQQAVQNVFSAISATHGHPDAMLEEERHIYYAANLLMVVSQDGLECVVPDPDGVEEGLGAIAAIRAIPITILKPFAKDLEILIKRPSSDEYFKAKIEELQKQHQESLEWNSQIDAAILSFIQRSRNKLKSKAALPELWTPNSQGEGSEH